MFTVHVYIKFAAIAVGFLGGAAFTYAYGFGYGWIFFLVGLLFLLSYLLLGTVQSASDLFQKMDFQGAEERLELTFFPRLLYVTNRAFYFILKGSIAAQQKDNVKAEGYFNQALSLNLPSDNEKGMVYLQMAGIQAQKNNWTGAKNYFYQAKGLKITEPQLKEQFKQFETAIQNRGQMKVAQSMGMKTGQMMMPGGKRRRPKMR
ncbi:MAG: hypothetical protein LW630_04420 [Saprospiraceae bacterium]|jgi:tetratricopeptide (TPR) repeat protein|nr:hypothetical protein [Saprospiraceae bacterium]